MINPAWLWLATSMLTNAPIDSVSALTYPNDIVPMRENQYGVYVVDVSLGRQFLFSGEPNSDPLPFVVDTGANLTAVPALIAEQLVPETELQRDEIGHGLTGQFETDLLFHDELNFGLGSRELDIVVLYENYGSVLGGAGILGMNAFQNETIVLDYPEREIYQIETPVRPDLRIDPEIGVIRGEAVFRFMDEPVSVMIDTGSPVTVVNTALAGSRRPQTETGSTNLSGVDDGTQAAVIRRLFGGMRVGDLCMPRFEVSVSDVYAFEFHGWTDQPAIILGMDILKHAEITIDAVSGAVQVEAIDRYTCNQNPALFQ